MEKLSAEQLIATPEAQAWIRNVALDIKLNGGVQNGDIAKAVADSHARSMAFLNRKDLSGMVAHALKTL